MVAYRAELYVTPPNAGRYYQASRELVELLLLKK